LRCIGLAGLEERIADPLEIVGGDADPGIGDAAASAAIPRPRRDPVTLPPRSVNLNGVDDEVERDLLEGTPDRRSSPADLPARGDQIDAAFPRLQRQQVAAIEQGCPRRERLRRNFENCRFPSWTCRGCRDHRQQVLAGSLISCASSLRRAASIISTSSCTIISEKPMMAFSGVRSSWLMVARKRVFDASALLGGGARQFQRLVPASCGR